MRAPWQHKAQGNAAPAKKSNTLSPTGAAINAADSPQSATSSAKGVDLSKLDRLQLLQLLQDAVRENEHLRAQLAEANRKLEDRQIAIQESGSLAEASLRLSGIFADAQRAIDLYRYNLELQDQAPANAKKDLDSEVVEKSAEPKAPEKSTEPEAPEKDAGPVAAEEAVEKDLEPESPEAPSASAEDSPAQKDPTSEACNPEEASEQ